MPNTLPETTVPQYFFNSTSCVTVLNPYLCGPQSGFLRRGNGNIAQLVEHSTENAGVVGSIPTVATKKASSNALEAFLVFQGRLRCIHSSSLIDNE